MTSLARLPRVARPVALAVVAPTDLHRHWAYVRAGLLRCVTKGGGSYLPEDAYHAIRAGTLVLFMLVAAGRPFGFVIVRKEEQPAGVVLFVWAMYTEPGKGRDREAAILDALRGLAVEVGAKRLMMWSGRKGWARRGWREAAKVYEMEV